MNRKRLLLITVLFIIASSTLVYLYTRFQEAAKPSWLKFGTYMTYEQLFAWSGHNQTEYMTWSITKLTDNFADLHLTSHGVNVTEGDVVLTLGEANWMINVVTREIVNSSDPSYIGERCPFWIETDVTIGSTIDIFYGINIISKSEQINVLGQQRDCWVVEYNWTTANMKRWYDKSSGIVLKIHVTLHRQDITIEITETAVSTNVDLRVPSFLNWMYDVASQFGFFGVFLVSLIGTIAIIVPVPYTLVILGLGAAGWNPILLAIAGGSGSAIGELSGYFLGYYGRRIISEERQRKMRYFLKLFGRYSPAAIFVFALTPLPDDLLFIPLGILQYNLFKAFIPAILGKLLMCYILASFGKVYGDILLFLFGDTGSWIGALIMAVLLILAIYALYRVDWEELFDKYVANRGKSLECH